MLAWQQVEGLVAAWGCYASSLEQWAIGLNYDCTSYDLMLPATAVSCCESHTSLPSSQLSCMHGAKLAMPIDGLSQNGLWTHEIKQLLHVDMQAMVIQTK